MMSELDTPRFRAWLERAWSEVSQSRAQLNAENLYPVADSDTGSVLKKQTLDLEYVENASLLYDFAMVACTALRLIGVPGSIATKLAGLTKRPEDSRFAFYYQDLWNKIEEASAKKS